MCEAFFDFGIFFRKKFFPRACVNAGRFATLFVEKGIWINCLFIIAPSPPTMFVSLGTSPKGAYYFVGNILKGVVGAMIKMDLKRV